MNSRSATTSPFPNTARLASSVGHGDEEDSSRDSKPSPATPRSARVVREGQRREPEHRWQPSLRSRPGSSILARPERGE